MPGDASSVTCFQALHLSLTFSSDKERDDASLGGAVFDRDLQAGHDAQNSE